MADPYRILDIEPNATSAEIQLAYNRKKAELLAINETDPGIQERLQEVEEAFQTLSGVSNNAIVAVSAPKAPANPILGMVDGLDAPLSTGFDRSIEYQSCPYCAKPNPVQANICGYCGKQISRPCPNCGKQVSLTKMICPNCNTMIQEYDQQRLAEGLIASQRVHQERTQNDVRVDTLEAKHRTRTTFGLLFWAVVVLASIGICVLGIYAISYFSTPR